MVFEKTDSLVGLGCLRVLDYKGIAIANTLIIKTNLEMVFDLFLISKFVPKFEILNLK